MTGERGRRPLRVAVLTGRHSGMYDALLTTLRERTGAQLKVVYERASAEAPFDENHFASLENAIEWVDAVPVTRVSSMLDDLQPDVILVTSWHIRPYVRLARAWRQRALRVMIMDNPWRGTLKQRAGVLIAPFYIRPAFDVVFLPNERQKIFARKLGFREDEIWSDFYCCDFSRFAARTDDGFPDKRSFLYVGRLVPEKGIDTLLEAYARYRNRASDPWPLVVVGTGPLESSVAQAEGVTLRGFVQPSDLPGVFQDAGCFVLASRFEPWGIVLHEAAAAGLPIVCTSACGASDDLVRTGTNGLVVPPDNVDAMSDALVAMTTVPMERRQAMSKASVELARRLTPERWADQFDAQARSWLARLAQTSNLPSATDQTT